MMLPSPELAAAASYEGYEYIALDMQHGYIQMSDVIAMSRAVRSAGSSQVVIRVPECRFTALGEVADAGADAVIVPLISSTEQAEECVQAVNYPPRGIRSWGPAADVIAGTPDPSDSSRRPELFLMIENRAGLDALEGICATEGVDGIYVGPSDLAFALGERPGRPSDEVEATIERIRRTVDSHGLIPGVHCSEGPEARQRAQQGFRFVTASLDIVAARRAFRRDLEEARPST